MYETISLRGLGEKVLQWINYGNYLSVQNWKQKTAIWKHCTLISKVVSKVGRVTNYDRTWHAYWNWTIKHIDGGQSEPVFLMLQWKFTGKQEKNAKILHMVMDSIWRHQSELKFCLKYR